MRIAAVIVNWNQAELTRRCVGSLVAGARVPDVILVVDNGSHADPEPVIRSQWPQVEVIRLPANTGFAGGANRGLEAAAERGADAAVLINNDAVAEAHCIAELEAALQPDERIAAVGGKTLTEEHPPRIHSAYGVLTFHGDLVQRRGWLEPDVAAFGEVREVDYVSGCVMLVRLDAVRRIGSFDTDFFAYHEDLDWCTRAWRAGYRIVYVPSAIVYHRMHASTGGGYESPITYLSQRNSILYVRKHARFGEMCKYGFFLCGNLLKEARLRARRGELGGLRLRLRGLVDGLRRRPVPLGDLGLNG